MSDTTNGKVVKVHDGDTVTVLNRDGSLSNIRLANIDAPELTQAAGGAARDRLRELVYGRNLAVEPVMGAGGIEKAQGRTVGTLRDRNDVNYNLGQVESGNALAYQEFLRDPAVLEAELRARQGKAGFWANGAAPDPSAYRHAGPEQVPTPGGVPRGLRGLGGTAAEVAAALRGPRVANEILLDNGQSARRSDDATFDIAKNYRDTHGDFMRGWHSTNTGDEAGKNRIKAALLQSAGDAEGAARLYAIAKEQEIEAGITAPKRFTEIGGVGDAVDWAQGALGQGAASALPMMAAAGMAKLGLRKTPLAKYAPYIGAGVTSLHMQTGENMSNFQNNEKNTLGPGETLAAAVGTAIPQAALDALTPGGLVAGKTLQALVQPGKKNLMKHVAGEALESAGKEGLTEGAQTLIGQAGENLMIDRTKGFNLRDVVDAAAAGAVGGAGMSTPFSAVNGLKAQGAMRRAEAEQARQKAELDAAAAGQAESDQQYADLSSQFTRDTGPDATPLLNGPEPRTFDAEGGPDFTMQGDVYPPMYKREAPVQDATAGGWSMHPTLPNNHSYEGSDLPDPSLREAPAPAVTDMTEKVNVSKLISKESADAVRRALPSDELRKEWDGFSDNERDTLTSMIREAPDERVDQVLGLMFGGDMEAVGKMRSSLDKINQRYTGSREATGDLRRNAGLDDDGKPLAAQEGYDLTDAGLFADKVHGVGDPLWRGEAKHDAREADLRTQAKGYDMSMRQLDKQMYMQRVPYNVAIGKHLDQKYPLVPAREIDNPQYMEQHEAYVREQAEMSAALRAQAKARLVEQGADPDMISREALSAEMSKAYALKANVSDYRPGDFSRDELTAMKVKKKETDGKLFTDGRIDVNMVQPDGTTKATPISMMSLIVETAKKRGIDEGDHGTLSVTRIARFLSDGITTLMSMPGVSKWEPFGKIEGRTPAVKVDEDTGEISFDIPDDTIVFRRKGASTVTFGDIRAALDYSGKAYREIRDGLTAEYRAASEPGDKAALSVLMNELEDANKTYGDIVERLSTAYAQSASSIDAIRDDIAQARKAGGYLSQLLSANNKFIERKLADAELNNQTVTEGMGRDEAEATKLNRKGRTYQEETGEQLGAYANDVSARTAQAAAETDVDAIIRKAERGRAKKIDALKRRYPETQPTRGQERVLALMQTLIERFAPGSALQVWFTDALPSGSRGFISYSGAIVLGSDLQGAKLVEVATHEFGHWFQNTVFEALPKNDPARIQIKGAWESAVTRLFADKMTAAEYAAEFLSGGTAATFEGVDTSGAALVRARAAAREARGKGAEYPISFPEWFANQFSKYVTSGQLFEGANEHTAGFMERLLKHMTKLFETMQAVFNVLGELTPSAWRKYKPAEAFTKWVDGLPASYTVRWTDALPDTTRGITPEMMQELRMSPEEAAARMAQRAEDAANVWTGLQRTPDGGAAAVKEQVAKEAAAQRAEAAAYEAAKKRHAQAVELGLPSVAPSPPWDHPDNAATRERLAEEIMKDKRKAERSNAAKAGWAKRRDREAELLKQANTEREQQEALLKDIEAALGDKRGAMKNAFKRAAEEARGETKDSAQTPRGEGMSEDVAEELFATLEKMFGKRITLLFTNTFAHGGSGRFTAKEVEGVLRKIIAVSVRATDPRGTLYHEALHAFVHELNKIGGGKLVRTLLRAAESAPILNQLKERLKDDPQALNSLNDPEERAAFMLQFYATDPSFTFGPAAVTFMEKARAFFSKVFKLISTEQQAQRILDYLISGQHAMGYSRPNATYKSLLARSDYKALDTGIQMVSAATDKLKRFIIPGDWLMRSTKIPALKRLAQLVYPTVGEGGEEGYLQSITRLTSSYFGAMAKHFDGTTEEQRRRILDALHAGDIRELSAEDKRLAAEIRRTLGEMGRYAGAVIDMGNLGPDYFPRVWDREAIMADQEGFLGLLAAHDIADGEKVMRRILAEETVDINEGESNAVGYTPAMSAALTRKLADITNAEASPFLNKDLFKTMHSYIRQAVKRTEYTRRFGKEGERLTTLLNTARQQGATDAELEQAKKYIMAVEGTLGYDIDPKLRDLMGGITLYENIRLLPMILMSSIVDPLGLAVRSGNMVDAAKAFKRGVMEIKHYLQDSPSVSDDMMQLAIDIGVMDHNVLLDAYQLATGTEFMSARQKKIQDMFFKYNLMSGWNHSMRTAATGSAVQFITRHVLSPNKHSARYLKELNLSPDMLRFNADGVLQVRTSDILAAGGTQQDADTLQAAIHRYVDGAVLRPNAAHRPIWMSDPHYALLSHLKQFTYSFHQTILKRVAEEMKNGNFLPLLPLLSYVPVSIAASMVKGIVQGGGEEPEWKKGWGVADYVWDGTQRAGLLGIRQFGVDVMGDVGRGETGLGVIAGPSVDHVLGFARDIGRGNVKHAVIDSLPANDMYGATLSRAFSSGGES